MPRWFTTQELSVLDALTANNKAVLASLGGRPSRMKEYNHDISDEESGTAGGMESANQDADGYEEDIRRQRSHSAVRQRMGSIHRAPTHRIRSHSPERNGDLPVSESNEAT